MGERSRLNRFHRDAWKNPKGVAACKYAAIARMDDSELLEQAKRMSHDAVIAMTGHARTSGVRWIIIPASKLDECFRLIDDGDEDPRNDPLARDELKTYLREHPDGALVAAVVIVAQSLAKAALS